MRSPAGFLLVALFACLGIIPSNPAFAERRVALVIGNGNYDNLDRLPNPANDANAMAFALRRLGFEVESGIDLNRDGMARLVSRFTNSVSNADVALIFYAGHAVQIDGENYLLPIDIRADQQYEVRLSSLKLSDIYVSIGSQVDTSLLLVDACRNNPFKSRGMGGSGLAPVVPIQSHNGSFVGFATETGAVASDGVGQNSPYTAAILANIETPDTDIYVIMSRVGDAVRDATHGQQRPSINSSLSSKGFVFKPETGNAPQSPLPLPPQQSQTCFPQAVDDELWRGLSQPNTIVSYNRYLELCPNGSHAAEARKKIEDLANVPKWYLAIYGDVDFWGGDIHAKGVEAETAEDCARICGLDTACKLFSFNPEKKQCFPKSKLDLPIVYPGIVSGLFIERDAGSQDGPKTPVVKARFRAFPGTAHSGPVNPGWQTIGKTKSIDACLRACDRDDSCRFVTFGDRQRNGSLCAQRFVGLFGDIFGKSSQSGAIAFDRDQVEIAPAGELIPLPGLENAR